MNLPLMNLHERVLSVLGCRWVDDVLIDAPYEVSSEMIASLNIAQVIHGKTSDDLDSPQEMETRYKQAMEAGIFTVIESPKDFSIGRIVERIQRNHDAFRSKFEQKQEKERRFYREKHQSNGNNGITQ